MKTQVIAALILAAAGTAMAQQPSQEGFRGRNSTNAPMRARQSDQNEAAIIPQFQRPARQVAPVGEEYAPAAPAPRGPQARQGVRGEQPEVPAVREPAQRPPLGAPQGRRGFGASQRQPGMGLGERPQMPPVDVQEFAPRRPAFGREELVTPEAPVRARQGRRGIEGAARPDVPAVGAPSALPGRRGPAGPQRGGMVLGERPQLPPVEDQEFAPRRPAFEREELVTPEAPVRARQGRGFEGGARPEVPVVEDPAALPPRRGPAGPQREGMIRGERPQQDVDYSADESEYESQADRTARAFGRRAR